MQAELRDLFSPDVVARENPNVLNGEPFSACLQADFGPAGENGQDQFDFLVCNPEWVAAKAKNGIVSGSNLLIMPRFDWDLLWEYLSKLGEQCTGSNWVEVARKLGNYGNWEYEYQDVELISNEDQPRSLLAKHNSPRASAAIWTPRIVQAVGVLFGIALLVLILHLLSVAQNAVTVVIALFAGFVVGWLRGFRRPI